MANNRVIWPAADLSLFDSPAWIRRCWSQTGSSGGNHLHKSGTRLKDMALDVFHVLPPCLFREECGYMQIPVLQKKGNHSTRSRTAQYTITFPCWWHCNSFCLPVKYWLGSLCVSPFTQLMLGPGYCSIASSSTLTRQVFLPCTRYFLTQTAPF